jgi:hypothetical protein
VFRCFGGLSETFFSVFRHCTLYGVTNRVTEVTKLVTHQDSLTVNARGVEDRGQGRRFRRRKEMGRRRSACFGVSVYVGGKEICADYTSATTRRGSSLRSSDGARLRLRIFMACRLGSRRGWETCATVYFAELAGGAGWASLLLRLQSFLPGWHGNG